MPIPFIIAGVSIIAGSVGIKKGIDSVSDNKEAKRIMTNAERLFNRNKNKVEKKKDQTVAVLEEYGKLKLFIWDKQFGRFVDAVSKVRNVELQGNVVLDINLVEAIDEKELITMKDISLKAGEILTGGATALGAGTLSGIAATGGATLFASASTGTAISSLAGVAATNATLAWFGGGSLAAGGLGMAGGTAILGGIVAGPILAVGGSILASKAKKNLAEAKITHTEARKAGKEMRKMYAVLDAVEGYTNQFRDVTEKLNERFNNVLTDLENIISSNANGAEETIDYKKLSKDEQQLLHLSYEFAQVIKMTLDTSLMDQQGAPVENCDEALVPANKLLEHSIELA